MTKKTWKTTVGDGDKYDGKEKRMKREKLLQRRLDVSLKVFPVTRSSMMTTFSCLEGGVRQLATRKNGLGDLDKLTGEVLCFG